MEFWKEWDSLNYDRLHFVWLCANKNEEQGAPQVYDKQDLWGGWRHLW